MNCAIVLFNQRHHIPSESHYHEKKRRATKPSLVNAQVSVEASVASWRHQTSTALEKAMGYNHRNLKWVALAFKLSVLKKTHIWKPFNL